MSSRSQRKNTSKFGEMLPLAWPELTMRTFSGMDEVMLIRSLNVSLTPELEHFIELLVASGAIRPQPKSFARACGYSRNASRPRKLPSKSAGKLRRGIEQADRGELLDGDAVFEEIRKLRARFRAEAPSDSAAPLGIVKVLR